MSRVGQAWRALDSDQRLAAGAAVGLFASMFLPWYSTTDTFVEHGVARAAQTSSNAFGSFSFVEAAVLLVSAGVLAMLFARAERRGFALPLGDGVIVTAAGAWTSLLVFYRLLDKPGLQGNQRLTATVGVQWGIFIALLVAIGLAYAGARMRSAERDEAPAAAARAPAHRHAEATADPHADAAWRHAEATGELPADAAWRRAERQAALARPDPADAPTRARRPEPATTPLEPAHRRRSPPAVTPAAAQAAARRSRARYPPAPAPAPAPAEQLSLEDQPPKAR
jgi:hypothetical protein